MQNLITQCPNCLNKANGTTPMDEQNTPEYGSICFCSHCGNINKFDKELKLVEVSEDDLALIKGISEEEYYSILEISASITTLKNTSQEQHESENI